jgi:hypothetical protein
MLVLWRDLAHEFTADQQQRIEDTPALDALLDNLHQQASADDYPHAVGIYAGNHYPDDAHGQGDQWIPADAGDGPQPELMLVIGTTQSPVDWTAPDGANHTSTGTTDSDEPELEFFLGGQESYAPAWSLVPTEQARQAARLFVASGGQRPGNITWRTPQPA